MVLNKTNIANAKACIVGGDGLAVRLFEGIDLFLDANSVCQCDYPIIAKQIEVANQERLMPS